MCHVLIIEGDWLIAEYLTDLVEMTGATSTAHACTERDAIDAAQKNAPAVIISEMHLLEGNGPSAVKSIRSALGTIPVIFLTSSPKVCEPCEEPRVILQKPARASLITDALKQYVPH